MLRFDPISKTITADNGGYSNYGVPIRDTYVKLTTGSVMHQRGILYQPVVPCEKTRIAVVCIHSDNDYSAYNICGELAKRGYTVLGGQVFSTASLDSKMLDIKRAVDFLRALPGIEKVVLMGHSGGATLMSAYQNAAENGVKAFQGDEKIYKCTLTEELTPADGVMLLDSNWGNGAMTLYSIDPAVVEEGNGKKIDPELDIFNPANGFDPEGSHYSEAFLKKFFEAQAARNKRIVDLALERLHAIESGKGMYNDDEPFVVTGGAQFGPCNKLFPQDTSLFAHTKAEHFLVHADGSVTTGIVRSLRKPRFTKSMTPNSMATVITTVRSYLSERAIVTTPDYFIYEDGVKGIDWLRTYDCPPGNIQGVHAPLLCMGMTGGYEYLAAEVIYDNAGSTDKTCAFVEGASHNFNTATECEEFPGQLGDTEKSCFDYVDKWLSAEGRFIG